MSFAGIFDIIRGSIHDGPGIRTTIFFKGCPLRCIWCHNPEAWTAKPQLFYNREKCVNCMECAAVCPTGVHSFADNKHRVNFKLCIACGKCVEACRFDALRIIGRHMDIDSIMEIIARDRDFYDASGGGVTLSGGEPMMQPDTALELLKKCREQGIHICLETCGYAPQQSYSAVLPFTGLFLFDYKATGAGEHARLTGVPNPLISDNLDYLYGSGAKIILRCPMIPGVNDSKEHLEGIARMEFKYPLLEGIELLPYHNMGVYKSECLGMETRLKELKNTSAEKKNEWMRYLSDLGCKKAMIG